MSASLLKKKKKSHLCNIVHICPSLNNKDVETVIHAFITSRLDLFSNLPAKVLSRLQLVQTSTARALTSTKKKICSHHFNPSPYCNRIHFKQPVLIYKASHDLAPSYLVELIRPYTPTQTLRSSSDYLLALPKF